MYMTMYTVRNDLHGFGLLNIWELMWSAAGSWRINDDILGLLELYYKQNGAF